MPCIYNINITNAYCLTEQIVKLLGVNKKNHLSLSYRRQHAGATSQGAAASQEADEYDDGSDANGTDAHVLYRIILTRDDIVDNAVVPIVESSNNKQGHSHQLKRELVIMNILASNITIFQSTGVFF